MVICLLQYMDVCRYSTIPSTTSSCCLDSLVTAFYFVDGQSSTQVKTKQKLMIGEFRQTRRELIRVFFISQQQHVSNKQARYKAQTSIAHHVPLKLFFALHEVEAKFTEKQLRAVIVVWQKRREIPCIHLTYLPSSIFAIFFTFVKSSCSRKLATSSSLCPCYQND